MKQGLTNLYGNIVTAAGASSGVAGRNLSIVMGDGNAAGNSAGGILTLKGGAGSGTGAGGSVALQPGTSATGAAGMVQILPTKATAGGTTDLRFYAINGTSYVGFKSADTITTPVVWTLPVADGSANQTLQTNGSGVLSWSTPTVPNVFVTINGNTGSATADIAADSVSIVGSVGITTVAADTPDSLTLNLTRTGVSAKATPVAADQFLMFDSAAGNAPVYATASTVASAIGAMSTARIVRNTFQNSGLTSGSIAITHNLAVTSVLVQVYDENLQLVQPDNITLTSGNVTTVDLSSFGTIAGTWSYVIFG